LTTKMLASTVQFSTNDQPTTITPHTKPDQRRRYARPGHAWQTPETQGLGPVSEKTTIGCSFRTQQGALRSFSAAPGPTRSHHPKGQLY
jgi:hypothetical protein